MDQHIEQLMRMASLEIEAYDMQTRREMSSLNRRMPCYVMSYLQSGTAILEIYDEVYEVGPGSIVIIPENVLHSHYKTDCKPATFLWWHFSFKIQYTIDALKLFNFPVVSYLKNREEFEKIFHRFYDGSREMNKLSELLMHRACGLELMAYLFEELITDKRLLVNARIPEAFWQIFRMLNGEDIQRITLSGLAQQFHMSPTYISNRFKHYFGISPIAMKNRILFERSKLMLTDRDMTISEIAEETGFESITGFTHFFSQSAGQSPSDYHSQNRHY